jgi:hypothetical protein
MTTKPMSKTQLARLASIELRCERDEHTPIEGNASATEEPELDEQTNAWIRAELNRGNDWAWCTVTVTATYDGVQGADSLGCCSYKSEGDFKRGGYYGDMRREALDRLHAKLIDRDRTTDEATSFVTQSWRQAITTKYSSGRIFVRSQAGSARIAYDHALGIPENHAAAAREYALRMQWSGQWVGGCLPDGHSYAFVLLPESMTS